MTNLNRTRRLLLPVAAYIVLFSSLDARGDDTFPCPPVAALPTPALTSDEINDFAHEIWSVQDDTVFKPPASNIAAGVLAGPAGFFNSSQHLVVHELAGPAVFYRLNVFSRKSAVLTPQALERGEMRLDRIIDFESGDLKRKLNRQLVEVQAELTHIATVEASLDEDAANPSPDRREYIQKVKSDLARQRADEMDRGQALCRANLQRLAWEGYAQGVRELIRGHRTGGLTGLEFMFGYGFDIKNPTTNQVYSGALGGVGLTALVWHAGVGFGLMAQQDGLLGVYLSLSAPIL
jgi:hypothetical protein